ncbi:MAG: hypothetical protein U5P41_01470 [Gammaproteobacteria bacterium]|nr:hypothetical protein [Gammaproteobacteria bacterium]
MLGALLRRYLEAPNETELTAAPANLHVSTLANHSHPPAPDDRQFLDYLPAG